MKKNQKDNIQFGSDLAKLTVHMEPPEPPPPVGFTSPFKTIQEWLFHLCDTNSPEKTISEYQFTLVERPSNKLLTLYGFNTYNIDVNVIEHRIDFKPATHKYFALPDEVFGNLSVQQVQERVVNEILQFIRSAKFQSSFLSKGNSITAGLSGEIWSR